jgi:hypothetical protein
MMGEVPISWPSPPRPEDYVVVPGSQGPRRDFRTSVGLREGCDAEGRVFDMSRAVRTARAWMKRRVESGQPALSGVFTRAEVTYAWPRDTRECPTAARAADEGAEPCRHQPGRSGRS